MENVTGDRAGMQDDTATCRVCGKTCVNGEDCDCPPPIALTIAGEAAAICGNKLHINCGDGQPIGVVELTFNSAEAARAWYCKGLKLTLQFDEAAPAEVKRLYDMNSAAPDLLAALVELLSRVDERCGGRLDGNSGLSAAGDSARAAIAKATGGAS